jgi:hypothetical protein
MHHLFALIDLSRSDTFFCRTAIFLQYGLEELK